MSIDNDKITDIFCKADDFCRIYDRFIKVNGLAPKRDRSKRRYHRDGGLSDAEVMTIMILFHLSGYRCLKHFYVDEVRRNMAGLFPGVCWNQRIHLHRVFRGLAQRGQSSMGWFYGLKPHLVCNEKGDLLSFMLTPGNVDDREPLRNKSFIERIFGRLFGDKGYICKGLFSRLFVDGIQLVTKLRSNMRGQMKCQSSTNQNSPKLTDGST